MDVCPLITKDRNQNIYPKIKFSEDVNLSCTFNEVRLNEKGIKYAIEHDWEVKQTFPSLEMNFYMPGDMKIGEFGDLCRTLFDADFDFVFTFNPCPEA